MSEPEFDQQAVRQTTDEAIERTFDELVEAWEEQLEAQLQHDAFTRENPLPEPPGMVIEGVKALIEYDRRKWQYEERLEELNTSIQERTARLDGVANIVKLLLPEGHSLRHTYQGTRPEFEGWAYRIEHERAPGWAARGARGEPPDTTITVQRTQGIRGAGAPRV